MLNVLGTSSISWKQHLLEFHSYTFPWAMADARPLIEQFCLLKSLSKMQESMALRVPVTHDFPASALRLIVNGVRQRDLSFWLRCFFSTLTVQTK